MEHMMRNKNQWVLAAVMAALLVAATWFCASVWRATPSMPLYGNIILAVAAVLVLVSGCGLIALMFYSHRKGYDEPARSNRTAPD
jgi:membrane protease YdiL (CAAX protease family)